jgi:hypothetical protein
MKAFLKALAAAAASGAASGLTVAHVDPTANPKVIGTIALAGAITGVLHYLLPSPLKPAE